MSASAVFSAIFDVVPNITVANGFNFDWIVDKGGDLYFTSTDGPKFNAVVLSEENIDGAGFQGGGQSGGGSQGEYTSIMEVELHARIPMTQAGVSASDTDYQTSINVLNGIEDLLKAFDKNSVYSNGICTAGAHLWQYRGYELERLPEEDKYNTIKAILSYDFQYRTQIR